MSFGSTVLVVVWLAVGFSGLLVGLVWLRSVESRSTGRAGGRVTDVRDDREAGRRASAGDEPLRAAATNRSRRIVSDRPEPDTLAG